MTYKEFRDLRQKSFNDLPVFFAFGREQFKEQMEARGLKETDMDKIYALGGGGYYLRSDAPVIRAWFNRKNELPELMKDAAFAEEAFYSEMCNHEYGINGQGDYDVCSCFGSCEYDYDKGGADYLSEMGYDAGTIAAYQAARKRYAKASADWY